MCAFRRLAQPPALITTERGNAAFKAGQYLMRWSDACIGVRHGIRHLQPRARADVALHRTQIPKARGAWFVGLRRALMDASRGAARATQRVEGTIAAPAGEIARLDEELGVGAVEMLSSGRNSTRRTSSSR